MNRTDLIAQTTDSNDRPISIRDTPRMAEGVDYVRVMPKWDRGNISTLFTHQPILPEIHYGWVVMSQGLNDMHQSDLYKWSVTNADHYHAHAYLLQINPFFTREKARKKMAQTNNSNHGLARSWVYRVSYVIVGGQTFVYALHSTPAK